MSRSLALKALRDVQAAPSDNARMAYHSLLSAGGVA